MSDCERLKTCLFFRERMTTMPGSMENYRRMYCWGRYEDCARRRVAEELGLGRVPDDLYPNEATRADRIIEQSRVPATRTSKG